jgi:hypothetical protein
VNVVIQTAELAERAGITEEQAVLAFRWMLKNGFANGNVQGCGQIGITFTGLEEAQRLRLPRWRRWRYKVSIRTPLVVSLIAGTASGLGCARGRLYPEVVGPVKGWPMSRKLFAFLLGELQPDISKSNQRRCR